jgi:mannose-6-phosphate isomerase-like protein (cupin superfamily)
MPLSKLKRKQSGKECPPLSIPKQLLQEPQQSTRRNCSSGEGPEKGPWGFFGLTQYGVNLTTLAPGSWSSHRHWHENEDEFVFVVEGEITLIDNAGEHLLKPGMCAGFKAGVANGHHLVNKTKAPVIYLEIGTQAPIERAYY